MATVSRGEITITNVDDGKTSYFHTAYTNSIDFGGYDYSGNPNLSAKLNASSFSSGTGATVADDNDEIVFTLDGTNPLSMYTTRGQTPLAEGKEYTISCEIMLESDFVGDPTGIKLQHAYLPGGFLMLQTDTVPKNELNTWQKLIGTKTMPHYSNTPNVWYPLFRDTRNLKPSGKVRLRNIKIEEGPTATPFQPNLLDAPYYLSKVSLGENIANPTINFPINSSGSVLYQGNMTEPFVVGQTYTITLKGTKPATQLFRVFNPGIAGYGNLSPVEGLTNVWALTFTPKEVSTDPKILQINQMPNESVGACQIDWLKIEKGDTRTPNIDSYKYLGSYTDFDQTDSLNPTKYSWSLIKGDKGDKGDNAPTISLSGATQVITVSKTGVITPSSSFTVVGTPVNTTITAWLYSVDGGAFVTTLPIGVTRSTNTVTINPATSTFKTLSIRAADATVMDIFTIARIIEARDGSNGKDGTNGSNGADGKDAYTVILSNEAYTFPGSTTGALAGSTTTTVSVYKGITKVNPTSITVGTKPTGMTSTVSGAVVTFTVTTAMVTKGGTVPIDIVVDGITFNKLFSYAISLQGVKGADGGTGPQGPPGVNGKEVFSGYLSNDSIVVPANNAGTVTDFSKANGTFTTFLGQVQLTSGVVYSLVSNSGLTSTINSSTGAYSVTAISGDTGTATYKAVYNGITIQKILIVTKAKQGPTGVTGTTGPKGDPTGIIAQSTAPTSPYVGMLWKNTTAGNGATYRWTGSAWEAYVFTAVNISVENLAAIVTRIGEIYNDYSRTYNDGTTAVGTLAIKDAEINNSGVIKNSSGTTIQTYESIVSHQLISMARYSGAGSVGDQNKLVASLGITFNSIVLNDRENGFSGQITAEQLTNVPWKTLPLAAGFAETEGATPQYRKIQNIDGSFSVQLRGRCGPTTGAFGAGTGTRIGTLPVGTRPTRLAMFPVAFSGGFVGRLQVELNGDLMVQVNQAGRTVTMIDGIVLPLG